MSNINERIKKLINDSKEFLQRNEFKNSPEENVLVYDGLIGNGDSCEFLFLLKEANFKSMKRDYESGIEDHRWNLAEVATEEAIEYKGKEPHGWQEICYWIEAYNHLSAKFVDSKLCGGNLLGNALVNIKKIAGPSSSNPKVFKRILSSDEYKKLICDEIAEIKPNIVVCCGTYEWAKDLYAVQKNDDVELKCGYRYFKTNINDKLTYFLEYMHPSQRGAAKKYALQFAVAKEVFGELKEIIGKS